jgi:hypothetical protein
MARLTDFHRQHSLSGFALDMLLLFVSFDAAKSTLGVVLDLMCSPSSFSGIGCVPQNYRQLWYSFLTLVTKIRSPNRRWKIICSDFN